MSCGIMCAIRVAAFGSDCNSGNLPQCVDWMCLASGIRMQILSSVMLFSSMDGGTKFPVQNVSGIMYFGGVQDCVM